MLNGFRPMSGKHCETTTLRNMFAHAGLQLSEPMLLGLGEGIDFQLWRAAEPRREMPVLSGRSEPGLIAERACASLGARLNVEETESVELAHQRALAVLDRGRVAGLKVDIFFLDYFSSRRNFASHFIALYGFDGDDALVVDTSQQGGAQRLPAGSLAMARNSREGFKPSRNLCMSLAGPQGESATLLAPTSASIWRAVGGCAVRYLSDRGPGRGSRGLLELASEMPGWAAAFDAPQPVVDGIGRFLRFAGTGGANFRNLYAEFLAEAAAAVDDERLAIESNHFESIAALWDEGIDAMLAFGSTGESHHLQAASGSLRAAAESERTTFSRLALMSSGVTLS